MSAKVAVALVAHFTAKQAAKAVTANRRKARAASHQPKANGPIKENSNG